MKFSKLASCFGLLFAATTCFAQMYTITDLGAGISPKIYKFQRASCGQLQVAGAFVWTDQGGFLDLGTFPGGTFQQRGSNQRSRETVTGYR